MTAIYRFARTADDLADEGDVSVENRLADLAAYRAQLAATVAGGAPGTRWRPVFEVLGRVLASHELPIAPLTDLLSAFEQDVVKQAYADRAELLDYTRRSAQPVGRLLLHLYRIGDAVSLRRSDAICTALQLANFWQDLSIDTRRGRLYVPAADCAREGVEPAALLAGHDSPAVRGLVASLVGWARELMLQGAPLVHTVPGRAGWELRLVVQGGLRILERIEALSYGTLGVRPTLGALDAVVIGGRALRMRAA